MGRAVTVFGLATCDTTRAARKWLDGKKVAHTFHDVRVDGVTRAQLEAWTKALGWEKVLNKASTTWRELSEKEKAGVDAKKAMTLMMVHPTLIKRPVVDLGGGEYLLGFKTEAWTKTFG